jgi:hypothetical protein
MSGGKVGLTELSALRYLTLPGGASILAGMTNTRHRASSTTPLGPQRLDPRGAPRTGTARGAPETEQADRA